MFQRRNNWVALSSIQVAVIIWSRAAAQWGFSSWTKRIAQQRVVPAQTVALQDPDALSKLQVEWQQTIRRYSYIWG